jgi:hypothetical protein
MLHEDGPVALVRKNFLEKGEDEDEGKVDWALSRLIAQVLDLPEPPKPEQLAEPRNDSLQRVRLDARRAM